MSLHAQDYRVSGVSKLWKAANRAGVSIDRDQTGRLMRHACLEGLLRRKKIRTTTHDPDAPRHPNLVNREFTAIAPNRLWATDLTYEPTWAGVAYVCLITDVFSRAIVGWRVVSTTRTETVLDAIEKVLCSRGPRHAHLRCHSDEGSQFTSIRYGAPLAKTGAAPSSMTVGDS